METQYIMGKVVMMEKERFRALFIVSIMLVWLFALAMKAIVNSL